MGGAAANVHKDIYKACRTCLTDRVMTVKIAAAECLVEMMDHASFLYTTELENMASLCFRALEGSNYSARQSVARLLGVLVALFVMVVVVNFLVVVVLSTTVSLLNSCQFLKFLLRF